MRVLIVFNHPAPYKVRIFNELAKYVELAVLFERNRAKDRPEAFYVANEYNFENITLTDGYVYNEGSISNGVRKYIKENHDKFDQIVMNGYSHVAEIKAIKYMRKHNIKFSLLINGGIGKNKEFFLKREIKKSLISTASFYMSPSKKSDEYLIQYGANKDNIYRYPYSNLSKRDMKTTGIDKDTVRRIYGLPVDKKIFVNASQFIDRLNNLKLLSLFKDREEFLLLIGEGNEIEKYNKFIKKNNMTNVMIMPFKRRNELFKILKVCDVFITLAKEDIFGHTTLEALANGLPVISSDKVMSSLEYIKDGENGYIVSLDNDQQIIIAIEKAPSLSKEKALESAKNNTYESCGKRIAEILEEEFNY